MSKFGPSEEVSESKFGNVEVASSTQPLGFNKNASELSEDDVYGSNGAYLNSKYGEVSVDQHQSMLATHTGIDDVSEEGAYGILQGVANTKGEAIDVVDVMNRWTKRGKYAEVGDPLGDLTSTPMTPGRRFRDWFKTNLAVRREIVGETTEALFKEGGAANAFSLIDFWPSRYRGLKELVGLDDFNIPIIDDIARTTKGLKLGQKERQEEFLGYLKENGYLGEAATIRSLSAVNETLIFLNEIKRLGMSYGGGGGNLTNAKSILSKLKHAQKISLFMALTQEDSTFKDRLDTWKVSSLYMSTPAVSGLFKSPAITKSFDFALNSLISNYKEGGYRDIIADEHMDGFDKIMAISELAGADIVFSALTKTFKSEAQPHINEANRIDAMAREGMRPAPMSDIQAERLEASAAGKGFVNVDRAEAEVKADLEATREQLEADINKIVEEERDVKAPVEAEAPKGEPKVVSEEKVAPEAREEAKTPLENKDVEKAVKLAVAETIKENSGKSADEQAKAVKARVEQLGEVLDAPKGTKVKTLVNRINNIRQKKPAYDISRKEYYKELQRVTKIAAESAVGEVAKITQRAHDLIDKSFPYRKGNKIKDRIQKLAEKGLTSGKFAERVDDILDRAYTAKAGIEKVVGIKDLSKQVDLSEAEWLRSIMKASQKAATGARRDVVDKIVASQKKAQSILDDMPKEVRAKMVASMKSIASAQSDDARDKALNKFSTYADKVIREFERSEAKEELKDAERSANKLVKSGKVSDEISEGITSITEGLKSGRIIEGLDSVIEKATSFDEISVASNIKQMLEGFEPKPLSQMEVGEIRQMTDALNGLVHQMNRISNEIKLHGRTQAKNRVVRVKSNISDKTPITGEGVVGDIKTAARKWNFDVIQIPRSISENLDYYNERGVFTEFQTRLEQSLSDTYRVEREVSNILSPHEKYMDKNGYAKNKGEKSFKVTNQKGAEISKKLGVSDRLRIYLASKDSGTWEAGMEFGWKRKYGEDTFKLTEQQAKDLFEQMPQSEKDVGDAFAEAYKALGRYMDERSMSLNGYRLSIDDYAGPRLRIGTKSDMKGADFEMTIDLDKGQGFNEQFHKVTAESSGRFKQRTSSKAPLLMYNPAKVIKGVERIVANYYGRGEVLRDLNNFLYESRKGGDQSLRDRYAKLGKEGTYNTFNTYVKDLNEGRGGGYKSEADKLIERITSAGIQYMSGKALKFNPKIVLSQAASLPTAGAVMDAKYYKIMERAFAKGGASIEEMAEKSPTMWARYRGRVGIMIGDKALSEKQQRGLGAMKGMDSKVIGASWRAMEAKVKDERPGLRGDAYNRAVENEVIDVIMKSQPSFEDISRPELARSTNPLAKMAMVFSSQRNKNLYLGTKALAGTMQKHADGTLKPKDVKDAQRVIKQLAIANAVFAAINTGMQQLIEEILDARGVKKKKYTNEDWSEETLDVAGDYVVNYLTAGLSSAGAWASMIVSMKQGFDAERTPLTTVFQDAEKLGSLAGDLEEIGKGFKEGDPDSVFKENWQKYGSHITTAGNLVVQPTTGVNIANLYKYLVEAPTAMLTREKRIEEYRMDNPDWYFEEN